MSERETEIIAFLNRAGWGDAARVSLAADASARSYQRLRGPKGNAVLMNAPVGGDQLKSPAAAAYNKAAHLAVDCRAFVTIGTYLRQRGFSAPEILAADESRGLLLLEDLGDDLYASVLERDPAQEQELYAAAIDLLLALHSEIKGSVPFKKGTLPFIADYDAGALAAEVALLTEWYAPHRLGRELSEAARAE